jgi:DNA repair ATPase RecN
LDPSTDYSDDLANVPPENLERVIEAIAFVYKWCHADKKKLEEQEQINVKLQKIRRNFSVSTQLLRMSISMLEEIDKLEETTDEEEVQPKDWETAYDMRPWPDFPDRALP